MSNLVVAYAVVQFDSNGVLQVPWSHHIDTRGVTVDKDGTFEIPWAKGVFTAVPAVGVQAFMPGLFSSQQGYVAINDFDAPQPQDDACNGGCNHATLLGIDANGCTVQTGCRSGKTPLDFCLLAFGEEDLTRPDAPQPFESSGLNIAWGVLSGSIGDLTYTPAYEPPAPWGTVGFDATTGYTGSVTVHEPFVPPSYSSFVIGFSAGNFSAPPALLCSQIMSGDDGVHTKWDGFGNLSDFYQTGPSIRSTIRRSTAA